MPILICPPGAADAGEPISHGTRSYPPYRRDHRDPASQWLVDVPPEVAVHLIHNGGFLMDEQIAPMPFGWAVVHHKDDPAAVPGDGRPHELPGHWWVPVERLAMMAAHGFVPGVKAGARDVAPMLMEAKDFGAGALDAVRAEATRIIDEAKAEAARIMTSAAPVEARAEEPADPPAAPPAGADGAAPQAAGADDEGAR